MYLINYNYGYLFDCSIHGKIIVTSKEWQDIINFIRKNKKDIGFWAEDIFERDIKRQIKTKKGCLVNIRTTLTEKVVKTFKTEGRKYKRNNYMFEII